MLRSNGRHSQLGCTGRDGRKTLKFKTHRNSSAICRKNKTGPKPPYCDNTPRLLAKSLRYISGWAATILCQNRTDNGRPVPDCQWAENLAGPPVEMES